MKKIVASILLAAASLASMPAQAQGFGMPGSQMPPGVTPAPGNVRVRVQAPRWVAPSVIGDYEDTRVVALDTRNPILIWMPPVLSGSTAAVTFTYDLKIVMVMPEQAPDQAIDRNPVVYQVKQLVTPQCLLPMTAVNAMTADNLYVAQVTTHARSTIAIELENKGKSELLLFRKSAETPSVEAPESETAAGASSAPSHNLSE